MKTLPILVNCLLGTLVWGAPPEKSASKPATPDPNAWSTHVYRLPSYELVHGFVTRERGQIHAPSLPPANAAAKDIEKFLRQSNDVVSQYLSSVDGVVLLNGSLAAYDPVSATLALRAPNSTQELVESYAANATKHLPLYLSFNVHLVEADSAVLRGVMKEASLTPEHQAQLEKIEALIQQGKARDLGLLHADARSGQKVSIRRGEERHFGTAFTLGEQGWVEAVQDVRQVGTTLDIEPTLGPDGRTVDVVFDLNHDFASPLQRWAAATVANPQRIESKVTDFFQAHVSTAITLRSGMTHLLGVWKPEGAPEPERAANLEAAFMTCDVVPLLPLENDRVLQLLKEHGEKVLPTPPLIAKPPADALPSGMVVRSFKVPPDFLTSQADVSGGLGPPPDPFAARSPLRDEPRAMRSVTAMDVLKMAGIPFPDGSSANFNAATGELVVRNLPENEDKVVAYVESLLRKVASSLACNVQVVQADATLLRQLASQTRHLADHAAAWRAVEEAAALGKAKFLSSTWLEARSGQRAKVQTGDTYTVLMPPEIGSFPRVETLPRTAKNAGQAGDKKAPDWAPVGFAAEVTTTHVGLDLDIEPVLGPDGDTVDLVFALEYDYAPPTPHAELPPAAEKTLRTDTPTTDFHRAKVTSAITLGSGMIRLLGIWKPEGSAEFQNGDVLQAAFIKVDVIAVEDKAEK